MRAAALLRGVAAAALVVAAFLAGRCSAEFEREDTAPPLPGTADRRDRDAPPPKPPRPTRSAGSTAASPDAPDERDPDPADAPDGSADAAESRVTLDVLVVDGEGAPVGGASVYVLPAGEPGTDDSDEVPFAETLDDTGRARVSVVRAGRYDVGAVNGVLSALAEGVAIPAAAPLRLQLPPEEVVMVRCDGPFAADDAGKPQTLGGSVHRAGDTPTRWLPGRGEVTQISWTMCFTPEQLTQPMFVPRGTRLRIQPPDGFVADPVEAVAPATVVLRQDPRARLCFRVRFEPAAFVPQQAFGVGLDFDAGPGSSPRPASLAWTLEPGKPLREVASVVSSLRVPDQPCTLRWTDELFRPGEVRVADPRAATEDAPVEVVVHVETERLVLTPPAAHLKLRFAPDPVLDAAKPEVAWCAWRGKELEGSTIDWAGGETHLENSSVDWLLAAAGFSFAGPVRVPAADGAVADLAFRTGGCLVIVPSGPVARDRGQLTVRRSDGLPIPRRNPDDEVSDFDWTRTAVPGLVLGPFPPGDVTFEVFLGRTRIAEVTGHVEAGRFGILRVPVRPRR